MKVFKEKNGVNFKKKKRIFKVGSLFLFLFLLLGGGIQLLLEREINLSFSLEKGRTYMKQLIA